MLYNWPSNLCAWYFYLFFQVYLQSSALGFLLAQKHFTNPLVAVPSAVSVVCMAVGVFLALAQTYCFHFLQARVFRFLFLLGNLLVPILLMHANSPAAWWECSCSLLEEQADTCWRQGWLQGMKILSRALFLKKSICKPLFFSTHLTQHWSGSHNDKKYWYFNFFITIVDPTSDVLIHQACK